MNEDGSVRLDVEFVDIKARTRTGKVVHYGFKIVGEKIPRIGLYCLSGRKYMPMEVAADVVVTCVWCAPMGDKSRLLSGNWYPDVSVS